MTDTVETQPQAARDVTMDRLEDQLAWYDSKSAFNRRWHVRLKLATLVAAALIPLVSGILTFPWIAGALGVLVVVFEGAQQLNQFHQNWVTYRGTCEALRHEKYLFLALAGPYATTEHPRRLLAERVESLVSTEHARWVQQQEQSGKGREAEK
jgi:hypothetical protein